MAFLFVQDLHPLQEICQLVTLTIGHWKVMVFHLRPFFDQKQKVKSWWSLTDYSDLLCEKVVDVYDQNMSTVAFWSLATSPGHVGIQRGNLMWHKIQPGPIRCFTWAEPNNSTYLCFFLSIFGQVHGPSPTIRPFYFLGLGHFAFRFIQPFVFVFHKCTIFQCTIVWAIAFLEPKYYSIQ